jgi:hypothetical protein
MPFTAGKLEFPRRNFVLESSFGNVLKGQTTTEELIEYHPYTPEIGSQPVFLVVP